MTVETGTASFYSTISHMSNFTLTAGGDAAVVLVRAPNQSTNNYFRVKAATGTTTTLPFYKPATCKQGSWYVELVSGTTPQMSIEGESGREFSPLDLAPTGWWDFSDPSRMIYESDGPPITSDGQPIYILYDKSGNGKDAGNSNPATEPIYKAHALKDQGVGRFTRTFEDMITAGGFTATQPNTFFVVGNTGNNAAFNCFFDGGIGTRQAMFYNGTGGRWEIFAGTILSGPLADTSPHVFACTFNGASSKLWVAGGAATTGDAGANGLTSGINLGQTQPGGSLALQGDLAEVIAYSGALTTAALNLVGGYLARKYGLTWTAAS